MNPRIALAASGGHAFAMTSRGELRWRALLQELKRLGYVEGETITIERWSGQSRLRNRDRFRARRLVASGPDVVVSGDSRTTRALKGQTAEIPIINMGSFPPDSGFVASFARPGGNITGVAPTPPGEIFAKQVQLLRDAVSTPSRVAWLGPRSYWNHAFTEATRSAAEQLGLALVQMRIVYPIGKSSIQRAFQDLPDQGIDGLFVTSAADIYLYREAVVEAATRAKLPAISMQREYAELGLLMSYSTDQAARYRDAAGYVDRILRGNDPAELPVQLPTAFEFVINLNTARNLGITMPPHLLAQATELIE